MFGTREFRFSYTDENGELHYIMARNQWLAHRALEGRGEKFSNLKRAPLGKVKPLTTGTCQICDREIGTTLGVIAHHGYTRPGHGWQTSSCYGAKHVAYEVGHDALDSLLPIIANQIELRTAQIADWLANPPATITFTKDGDYDYVTRKYKKIDVTVERPANFDPKAEVDHYSRYADETYARRYEMRLAEMQYQLKTDKQDLAHFTQRRANWKEPK
jgi:hypothetical protein